MKLFKNLFKGLLILLIVISLAAIIYVLQWKEEPGGIKQLPKEPSRTGQPKDTLQPKLKSKTTPEIPVTPGVKPEKEKEKIVVSKIEKIPPLPQRQIVLIIDDIGNDLRPVRELLKIDADLTFAILPLCSHTRDAADMLHAAHREILLHLPMEPEKYPQEKPGNGALFTDMNNKELLFQLEKDLASVPYISGVNNHMGSKFMGDEEKLKVIFEKLKKENLFFIDSRTSVGSKASSVSEKVGLQMASRKIFLDNSRDYNEIYKVLVALAHEKSSGDNKPVIIIGHPYPETIRAIKDATQILRENGLVIVPASKIMKGKTHTGSS